MVLILNSGSLNKGTGRERGAASPPLESLPLLLPNSRLKEESPEERNTKRMIGVGCAAAPHLYCFPARPQQQAEPDAGLKSQARRLGPLQKCWRRQSAETRAGRTEMDPCRGGVGRCRGGQASPGRALLTWATLDYVDRGGGRALHSPLWL